MNTRKSIFNSFLGKYLGLAIQTFSSIAIARLLNPEDMGVFSVSVAILGFVHMLRDFGINSYIVQERELTESRLRAAFTLNVIISWILGSIVYFSAKFAANFYQTPDIKNVLEVTSLVFFMIPFGANTMAILQREMRFAALNIINLSGIVAGTIVSVGCAYLEFGYISLAWGTLVTMATSILTTLFFRQPLSLLPSFREMGRVFEYGSLSSLTQIIAYAGGATPELIIGKVIDMSSVGIYGRAISLLNIIQQFITSGVKPVLLPYFSKISTDQLRAPFLNATNLMLGIAWPTLSFLVYRADLLIEVIYGPKWLPATPIVQIIGVAIFFGLIINFSDELFKASGQIKSLTKITTIITILQCLGVIAASQYGIIWIAFTLACILFVRLIITTLFLKKLYQIVFGDIINLISKNGIITITSTLGLHVITLHNSYNNVKIQLVYDLFIFGLLWLTSIILLNHQIKKELIKILNPKKQANNQPSSNKIIK